MWSVSRRLCILGEKIVWMNRQQNTLLLTPMVTIYTTHSNTMQIHESPTESNHRAGHVCDDDAYSAG